MRTMITKRWPRQLRWTLLALATPVGVAGAAQEMRAHGVADFGASWSCSNGSTHKVHNDTPYAFTEVFSAMAASGQWNETLVRLNVNVSAPFFSDASKQSLGLDESALWGADAGDVM